MTNNSLRLPSITVNGLDVSKYLETWSASDSILNLDEGLIPCQGQMVLRGGLEHLDFLDDLRNPAQWARGSLVLVDYPNSGGQMNRHPRGHLYILKSQFDSSTITLTLQLGCTLVLHNQEALAGDDSAVPLGIATNPDQIVSRLLQVAGCPTISVGTIGDIYPINYPLGRNQGSVLAQAGKITSDCGVGKALWQNGQGRIEIVEIVETPSKIVDVLVGKGEVGFKRITGPESPSDVLRGTGTVNQVRFPNDDIQTFQDRGKNGWRKYRRLVKRATSQIIETTETTSLVKFTIGVTEFSQLRVSHVEQIQSDYFYPTRTDNLVDPTNSQRLKRRKTKVFGIRAEIIADWLANDEEAKKAMEATGANVDLVTASIKTEEFRYYDLSDGQNGEILTITTTLQRPVGSYFKEAYNFDPRVIYDKNTRWHLASNNILVSEETQVTYLALPGRVLQQVEQTALKARIIIDPSITEKQIGGRSYLEIEILQLVLDGQNTFTETSNSGQLTPPREESYPPARELEQRTAEFQYSIAPLAGSYPEKQRDFQIEYLTGEVGKSELPEQQLEAQAAVRAKLIIGRYKGCQFELPWDDAWFGFRPFDRISVKEIDRRYAYWVDGVSFVMSRYRHLVGGVGVQIGEAVLEDDYPDLFANWGVGSPGVIPPSGELILPLFRPVASAGVDGGMISIMSFSPDAAVNNNVQGGIWPEVNSSEWQNMSASQWIEMDAASHQLGGMVVMMVDFP